MIVKVFFSCLVLSFFYASNHTAAQQGTVQKKRKGALLIVEEENSPHKIDALAKRNKWTEEDVDLASSLLLCRLGKLSIFIPEECIDQSDEPLKSLPPCVPRSKDKKKILWFAENN